MTLTHPLMNKVVKYKEPVFITLQASISPFPFFRSWACCWCWWRWLSWPTPAWCTLQRRRSQTVMSGDSGQGWQFIIWYQGLDCTNWTANASDEHWSSVINHPCYVWTFIESFWFSIQHINVLLVNSFQLYRWSLMTITTVGYELNPKSLLGKF